MTNLIQQEQLTFKEARSYYNLFRILYLKNKKEVDEHNATLKNTLDENRKFTDFYVLRTIENGRVEFDFGKKVKCLFEAGRYIARHANADKNLIEEFKKLQDASYFQNGEFNFDIVKVVYDAERGIIGVYDTVKKDFVSPNYTTMEKDFWDWQVAIYLKDLFEDFTIEKLRIEKSDFDDEDLHWQNKNIQLINACALFLETEDKDRRNKKVKEFFGYSIEELEEAGE